MLYEIEDEIPPTAVLLSIAFKFSTACVNFVQYSIQVNFPRLTCASFPASGSSIRSLNAFVKETTPAR